MRSGGTSAETGSTCITNWSMQPTSAMSASDKTSEYSYTFAGWPTKMTARHLSALGIKAECYGIKNPRCLINGKVVDPAQWYSLEDIAELVNPEPPPKRERREPVFVNLTPDLFEVEYA